MKVTITIELDEPSDVELARIASMLDGKPQVTAPAQETKPVPAGAPPVDARPWQPVPELLESDEEPAALVKTCTKCFKEFTTASNVRTQCDDCFFETEALHPGAHKPREIVPRRGRLPKTARDRSEPRFILEGVKHGTQGAYKKGCRCWPCTDEHSEQMREYAERRKARESA